MQEVQMGVVPGERDHLGWLSQTLLQAGGYQLAIAARKQTTPGRDPNSRCA